MAKLEVPDSALTALAGEEMDRLRKEVKKLSAKVEKQDELLRSRAAVSAKARELYDRIHDFAVDLKEEFGLYDW
jgi:predicted transcriptional regulator